MFKAKFVLLIVLFTTLPSAILAEGVYSQATKPDFGATMVPDPAISGFPVSNPDPNNFDPNDIHSIFSQWASKCIDYSPVGTIASDWLNPQKALGPATGNHFDICSLGDLSASQIAAGISPGSITLGFGLPISNHPGPDFVVFENSFLARGPNGESYFINGELAFVEVSTNGDIFTRFPSVSLNDPNTTITPYKPINPTNIYNLAGKHQNNNYNSWGTPFDLNDLKNNPEVITGSVNLANINYIRIVDIPGTGDFSDNAIILPDITTIDSETGDFEYYSENHAIRDPWQTWGSGGFDLEAVGVLNLTNGDGNTDGIVDIADLLILLDHWLEPAYWYYGDYNQDGMVNVKDMAILLQNWQRN